MFANNETLGNVKIFISDSRLIYKIYPYKFFDSEYKHKKRNIENRQQTSEEKKLLNAYAKKMDILGYGLCNDWQYFFTGTIDPKSYAANDFDSASKLISHEFYRMRQKSEQVKYMFILEKHKNGNYHAHGFCNVPSDIINYHPSYIDAYGRKIKPSPSKFITWGIDQCWYNLGINTISPVLSKDDATDYCVKYIIKSMECGNKWARSVFHSKGLKTFKIEYGSFIGDDFRSCLNVYSYDGNKYGINNIYQYDVKSYSDNIKEITLQLK